MRATWEGHSGRTRNASLSAFTPERFFPYLDREDESAPGEGLPLNIGSGVEIFITVREGGEEKWR